MTTDTRKGYQFGSQIDVCPTDRESDEVWTVRELIDEDGHIIALVADADADRETQYTLKAAPDLLAALEELHKQIWAHVKMDVKKHFSLMVADAAATKAIRQARGDA